MIVAYGHGLVDFPKNRIELVSKLRGLPILILNEIKDGEGWEMAGLGKKRTPYGAFLDEHGIPQQRIQARTGLNKDTITRACNDLEYRPKRPLQKLLLEAARDLGGKDVGSTDFWA